MISLEAHRSIPGTLLQVSPFCLGTMTFGAPVDEAEAAKIVHLGLDHGLNFIDTANSYEGYARVPGSPGGVAEEILGRALATRRSEAVIATKVGNPIGPAAGDRGLSRAHVLRACEASLRRLGTDWIDLYYMHRPDPETPIAESIAAFAELITVGKVRHWGLSNFNAAQTREILALCAAHGWPRPVAHQPPYSLLKRAIEADLLPLCREEGIAVVPYQVLQCGLLTGKYAGPDGPPAGTRGAEKPDWIPLLRDPSVHRTIHALTEEASAAGRSLLEHTLLTTLGVPGIVSVILGVGREDQLRALLR
jgi:aryl-alcohol dehydrogenase-like predicted oxidoreductase